MYICIYYEAETLSNRIGILSNGKLKVYGTPLFLNRHCSVGYNLIFSPSTFISIGIVKFLITSTHL